MTDEKTTRAQLRHSSDTEPGYTRRQMGRYWAYFDEKGERIKDRETIDRLTSVGLPPAYTNAWFCRDPNGHLQAVGVDARGRKQYRYHPAFRARRDKKKYTGTLEFGAALPKLRRKVAADLKKPALSREAVLAAVVRLLDTQYLRVGNEQYVKENKSYGATTLRSRHVKRSGAKLMMRFPGKHGITHEVRITDARLKRIVAKCHDLPGQQLFQYVDESGETCAVTSADVNDYIREATGGDFTAKNFRTWGASVIAFEQMLEAQEEEKAKITLKTVLEPVAEALGNTPAISRKSYVHPKLIEVARERPRNPLDGMERPRGRKWMSSAEIGLLDFLAGRKRRAPKSKDAEAVEQTAEAAIKTAETAGPEKVRAAAEQATQAQA
jgi:DNA topoisomerase-1